MSPDHALALRTVRQWQSETDAIREAPEPLRARATVMTLAAMVVCLIAVTPFLTLDRTVTSRSGRIVSAEGLTQLQALDPSLIKSIDVREGQVVAAGQRLATLDPTFASADVAQLRQQVASLDAQIGRAQAELAGTAFAPPDALSPDDAAYFALQAALFGQRAAQNVAQLHSFDEKMGATRATLAKLQADKVRYVAREKIFQQIETMRDTLYKSGSSSYLNLLQASDSLVEMQRTREFGENSLVEADHQLSSLQADRDAYVQNRLSTISQELVTARNARDAALAQLQKAEKHRDLVQLTATEPSVVLSIPRLSVGSVLREGDPAMTLVPLRSTMEAEIQIGTRDIGFVRAGDRAVMKIDAFNYFEHGTGEGRISWISDGAFTTDEDGKPVDPYYKARIAIDALHLTAVPASMRLIPGMTLTADVKVGKRSVFAYVMGGFLNGVGDAMRGTVSRDGRR